MIPSPPRAFHLSLHPNRLGSQVPPNECATLLSLAPELGVAKIGQDFPKLQERMLNGCPGGWQKRKKRKEKEGEERRGWDAWGGEER